MSSSSDQRKLLPKYLKPETYLDIKYIRASLALLDSIHNESDVERFTGFLLNKYFPDEENWSKVSQFLVPEIKRPDRVVEKFDESTGSFTPVIYVELKSEKGDSTKKALEQSTSSMPELLDSMGGNFSTFLIIIKGHYIAFFEYHNDRSNLVEDGVPSYKGAVPFNHAPFYSKDVTPGRPEYRGVGSLEVFLEEKDPYFMEGIFLDLLTEDVTVQNVLNWMKDNHPLGLTGLTPGRSSIKRVQGVDSAPFPHILEDDHMAD
jgi:hypothetical protein